MTNGGIDTDPDLVRYNHIKFIDQIEGLCGQHLTDQTFVAKREGELKIVKKYRDKKVCLVVLLQKIIIDFAIGI